MELEVRSLWAKTPKGVTRQWLVGPLSVSVCDMERLPTLNTSWGTAGLSEVPGSPWLFGADFVSLKQDLVNTMPFIAA